MIGSWFRVREADGHIVGVCRGSEERALSTLKAGQVLMAAQEGVSPHRHRLVNGQWVEKDPEPAPDYAFMRSSGYDVGAQVGAMMKVIEALAEQPEIAAALPENVKAEFDALAAHNAALKAAHPKP